MIKRLAYSLLLLTNISFLSQSVFAMTGPVGALTGEPAIDASGGAGYTIPIVVPSGTAGVQPQLSFSYSSFGSDDGVMGLGWNIQGTDSKITRCSQNVVEEGVATPIKFSAADLFCLNGVKLVVPDGSVYGANGTVYYTKIDAFSKIVSYGSAGTGPAYFKVWTKAGDIMEFGNTNDSRVEQQGSTEIVQWSLNKVADRYGNYQTYTYVENSTIGEHYLDKIDYTGNSAQSLSPKHQVKFNYIDRTDFRKGFFVGGMLLNKKRLISVHTLTDANPIFEYRINYIIDPVSTDGKNTNQTKVASIQQCSMVSGSAQCTPATNFGWQANGYDLPVSGSNVVVNQTPNENNDLGYTSSAVQAPIFGDVNGDGFADAVWMWFGGNQQYQTHVKLGSASGQFGAVINSSAAGNGTGPAYTCATTQQQKGVAGAVVQDMDGDNIADAACVFAIGKKAANYIGVMMAKGNGDGTFGAFSLPVYSSLPGGQNTWSTSFADLNNDGRQDVIWVDKTNGGAVYTSLKQTNGAFAIPVKTTYSSYLSVTSGEIFLDINGDTYPDILSIVAYSGIFKTSVLTGKGDGTFDYNASLINQSIRTNGNYGGSSSMATLWNYVLGDMNGDGNLDVAVTNNNTASANNDSNTGLKVDLAYGKGDGRFVLATPTIVRVIHNGMFRYGENNKWTASAADMNGDGKDDFVWMVSDATRLAATVVLSAGDASATATHDAKFRPAVEIEVKNGDFASEPITSAVCTTCYFDQIADISGDGISDLVWSFADTSTIRLYNVTNLAQTALLKTVTDGLGVQSQFTYKSLTDTTVYTKASGAVFPAIDVVPAQYVLSQVQSSNGIGGFSTTQYKYKGKRYDLRGPDLNFSQTEVIDVEAQTRQVNEFANNAADVTAFKEGTLTRSRSYILNNILVSDKVNTWNVVQLNGGKTRFLYMSPTVTRTCDVGVINNGVCDSSNALSTVTTTTTYDLWGNATQAVTTTLDKTYGTYTKTVNNTYFAANTANWILGRLKDASVTSTAPNQTPVTRTSSFVYDTNTGSLTDETIEPNNAILWRKKNYAFNLFGQITTTTESWPTNTAQLSFNSRQTTDVYDATGRFKQSTTNALNQTQTFAYNNVKGTLTSATDANNINVPWESDDFGRATKETRPDGSFVMKFYEWCDAVNNPCPAYAVYTVTSRVCAAGAVCNTSGAASATAQAPSIEYFDSLNRVVKKVIPGIYSQNKIHQDTQYDEQGRAKKVSQPYYVNNGVPTTIYWNETQFDYAGRPSTILNPNSAVNGSKSISYSGQNTTVINELNQTSTQKKNALGQLMEATDNANGKITYEYDAIGNLTKTTTTTKNAAGVITNVVVTMAYDLLGNKTSMNDPNMGAWSYTYNGLGLLATQTDNKNVVTKMSYDKLGRMTSRIDDVNNVLGSSQTTNWTYDTKLNGVGKLATVNSPNYSEDYSYDNKGRLQTVAKSVTVGGTTSNYSFTNQYDAYSRVFKTKYPTNYEVTSVWNEQGYLEDVKAPDGSTIKSVGSLDVFGQEDQVWLGAAQSIHHFDPATGRLDSMRAVVGGSSVLDQYYDFDALGNLIERRDTIKNVREVFNYTDGLNRLNRAVTTKLADGAAISDISVSYDGNGNISYKSDVGNYAYGASCGTNNIAGPNAVSSISGIKNTTYCYDKNGNMISGDGRTVAYSAFSKPINIVKGSNTVAMQYDANRNLVVRTDTTAAGTTTTTLLGSYEKVEDNSGTTHKLYIGDFAVVIQKSGQADKTNYFHKDHLGSTIAITDQNGAIVEYFSFDAWGKRRNVDATAAINDVQYISLSSQITNKGFTGHEQLDPVGLVHMGGRVYDPTIGRFLSADPFIQAPDSTQSYNRYSYVMNNPLSLTDPTGYFSVGGFLGDIFKALGKVLKAVVKITYVPYQYALVKPMQWAFREMRRSQFMQAAAQMVVCMNPALCGVGVGLITMVATGGDIQAAFRAGVVAAMMVPIYDGIGSSAKGKFLDMKLSQQTAYVGAHAAAGGLSSVMGGGKFKDGAMGGAFSMVGHGVGDSYGAAAGFVAAVVAGGAAASLTGGKFESGAMTAAFAYVLNYCAHNCGRDRSVYAAEDGTIETAGWENPNNHNQGYGYRIKLRADGDGSLFVYAHVDPASLTVSQNDIVVQGQLLGQYADPTNGGSTGPHLHFEHWSAKGKRLDPSSYLSTVMPSHIVKDTIKFRGAHPVSGKPKWHNGYDLVGPLN